jgi:hypothetical protein
MKFVTITDISKVDLAGHDGLRLGQNKAVIVTNFLPCFDQV